MHTEAEGLNRNSLIRLSAFHLTKEAQMPCAGNADLFWNVPDILSFPLMRREKPLPMF
jgi:hypothetical protein